jgi:hypothetical protein
MPGLLSAALALGALAATNVDAEIKESSEHGFVVGREVVIKATPDAVYGAFDGDISGWWDHSHAESPKELYIETKPGGGFIEIFDDEGNGALHATVIYAERGKLLRFVGPLGLAGNALDMVHTLSFEPHEGGTRVTLTIQATGLIRPGWDEAIDQVWQHFLVERLKPYVENEPVNGE